MVSKLTGEHKKIKSNLQQAAQAAYSCQGTCFGAFTLNEQLGTIFYLMEQRIPLQQQVKQLPVLPQKQATLMRYGQKILQERAITAQRRQ